MRTFFLALLALAISTGTSIAQVPIPELTGRVVDNAEMLTSSEESRLTDILRAYEDSTSNQVVVLTVATHGQYSPFDYSFEIARSWALGQADKDNGVLIFIARDDQQIFIQVGTGLEGAIPDAICNRIYEGMRPFFRNQNFAVGIEYGINRVIAAAAGEFDADTGRESSGLAILWAILIFLGAAIVCIVCIVIMGDTGRIFAAMVGALAVGSVVAIYGGDFWTWWMLLGAFFGAFIDALGEGSGSSSGGSYSSSGSSSSGGFGGGGGGSFSGGGGGGGW